MLTRLIYGLRTWMLLIGLWISSRMVSAIWGEKQLLVAEWPPMCRYMTTLKSWTTYNLGLQLTEIDVNKFKFTLHQKLHHDCSYHLSPPSFRHLHSFQHIPVIRLYICSCSRLNCDTGLQRHRMIIGHSMFCSTAIIIATTPIIIHLAKE